MITPKDIGKIYQDARKEKGLSVEQAYTKSRIHPKVITDIEDGVFDRLNKLYVKSFLKKYAIFLGLNPEDMLKKFDTISKKIPEAKFDLSGMDKKKRPEKKEPEEPAEPILSKPVQPLLKKPKLPSFKVPKIKTPQINIPEFKKPDISLKNIPLSKEMMQMIAVGLSGFILIILVLVMVGMIKDRMSAGRIDKKQVAVKRIDRTASASKTAKTVKEEKPVAVAPTEKEPSKNPVEEIAEKVKDVFTKDSSDKLSKVILKLKARDKAWVQIKENDKIIYDGIMEPDESKKWESDGQLVIWTGKAGELEFYVNTRKFGVIANGVVKNIKVSSKGIQIDDSWVAEI